jgi:hypothetical protein
MNKKIKYILVMIIIITLLSSLIVSALSMSDQKSSKRNKFLTFKEHKEFLKESKFDHKKNWLKNLKHRNELNNLITSGREFVKHFSDKKSKKVKPNKPHLEVYQPEEPNSEIVPSEEEPEIPAVESNPVEEVKIAFIGDQGIRDKSKLVLELIKEENAELIVQLGDFDYHDDPDTWMQQTDDILGEDFPLLAVIGNHEVDLWPEYQQKLQEKLDIMEDVECSGDLGVKTACNYKGIFLTFSGIDIMDTGHLSFIKEQLAEDNSVWKICAWHKNQRLMQVGDKEDEVGWEVYDECRRNGAIIATAHSHSYSRTHLMSNFRTQEIDSTSNNLQIEKGKTFAFVSGLGGMSRHYQDDELVNNPWWASTYISDGGDNNNYGALFCTFNENGEEGKGHCYFKDIAGNIIDQFDLTSKVQETEYPIEFIDYSLLAKEEADWIMRCKRDSGTFAITPNSPHVMPYYSNLALTYVTKVDSEYQEDIKNYILWYLDNLNMPDNLGVEGTIYDYYIEEDGTEVPEFVRDPTKKNYDSSDSYASTFLSLVYNYHENYGDDEFVLSIVDELKIVAFAVDATMQDYGLTYAKPDYATAYMMDNTEVWRGYQDFALLLDNLNDEDAGYYQQEADRVREAIETYLWDEEKQGYKPYKRKVLDWNRFYPDARANMRAITFDLPEALERKETIYNTFITLHPEWVTLEAGSSAVAAASIATIKVGETDTALEYIHNARDKFPDRSWPWYITQSGYLVESYLLLDEIN